MMVVRPRRAYRVMNIGRHGRGARQDIFYLLSVALLGGLVAVAVVTGEAMVLPSRPETWIAMAYLIGPGSIGVFVLVLYVLARWTASATSYAFLLFPFVAIALGALLLREPVQPSFLAGGAVVLAGVYLGVVYRPRTQVTTPMS